MLTVREAVNRFVFGENKGATVREAFDFVLNFHSYDVYVYKDDEKVYARDRTGKLIASGVADVDDASVIQSAVDWLKSGTETISPRAGYTVLRFGGGSVFISAGAYIINEPIELHRDIKICGSVLSGSKYSGTRLFSNGNNIFQYTGTDDTHFITFRDLYLGGSNAGGWGIYLNDYVSDVRIENVYVENFSSSSGGGIYIGNAWGLVIYGAVIERNYYGLQIYSGSSASILGTKINRNEIGVYLNSQVSRLEGNEIARNNQTGLWIIGAKNVIVGNRIQENSEGNAGLYPDIKVGAGADNNIIVGNMCISGITNNPSYNVYFINGASGNIVAHNQFANPNGIIGGYPDGNTIKYNEGYKTENYGTATFSGDGTTTQFTIAHGLDITPEKVVVIPMSSDASDQYYVSVDATNIYVNYITAPVSGTDNIVLSWAVE